MKAIVLATVGVLLSSGPSHAEVSPRSKVRTSCGTYCRGVQRRMERRSWWGRPAHQG